MIEEILSTRHFKSPSFSHCGEYIFFLADGGERKPVLSVRYLDCVELRLVLKELPNLITEVHVSSLNNHIALVTSGGSEIGQIHMYEWKKIGDGIVLVPKSSTSNSDDKHKHIWGGFEEDGFVFFRLESDEVSWALCRQGFDGNEPNDFEDAGYFPEMLGKLGNNWVWRNKEAKTKSRLNGHGDVIDANIRSARLDSAGVLYALIDRSDACAGSITKITSDEHNKPTIQHQEVLLDEEWFLQHLPLKDSDHIPLGELHEFKFLSNDQILLHFNENGFSRLKLVSSQKPDDLKDIELKDLNEKCNGEVWIDTIALSPNKQKMILEVMNFSVGRHLWLFDIKHETLHQIIGPESNFDMNTKSQIYPTGLNGHGHCNMQYYEITSKEHELDKGTVIFFHGGPAVQTHVGRYFETIVALAKAGYQVIAPNPAGSLGRGGKHINLDNGSQRLHQFDSQIIPFVEHMINTNKSVYLYGGSYAGWLIAKILTSDIGSKICAAVVRNGVVDWKIFSEEIKPFRTTHRAWEYVGEPSFSSKNAARILVELSPKKELNCKNVLFFTGEKDIRVPPTSAKEFLRSCNLTDDEIEQIHTSFPNEGHSIKAFENKKRIIEETIALFEKHKQIV